MTFLLTFFLNLSLLNSLFNLLESIDSARILEYSYLNLSEDLDFIGAQFNVNFSYFLYSVPISLLLTIILTKLLVFDFKNDKIEILLKKFLLIGSSNLAILCFFIYFLRLYELLSRAYVLIYILLYPFLYSSFKAVLNLTQKKIRKPFYNLAIFPVIIGLIFINTNFYTSSLDNILNRDKVKDDFKTIAEETIESLGFTEDQVLEDEECSPWLGTGTLAGCVGGTKISSLSFEQQVTNLTVFDNKLYIVFKEGTVYLQESQDSELELFLDLNEIVHTEFPGMSQGLYDIAFETSGISFLVS